MSFHRCQSLSQFGMLKAYLFISHVFNGLFTEHLLHLRPCTFSDE